MALSGYSGTPLVKKLGIKPGTTLAIVRAPRGFRRELTGLPDAVTIKLSATPPASAPTPPDLMIWFVTRRDEFEAAIGMVARTMGAGLWVAWPKKASGVTTDLTENVIRDAALPHGIVDYKVCAINDVWSGLKFARRRV